MSRKMATHKNGQMQKYLELAEHINSLFPQFQTSPAELANLSANRKIDFFRMLLEEYHVNIETVLKTNLEKVLHPTAYQNIMYVYIIYVYTVTLFDALYGQRLPIIDFLKPGSSRIANKIKVMVHFYCYTNNFHFHTLKPIYDAILFDYEFLENRHKHLDDIKNDSNRIALEVCSCEDIMEKHEEETKQLILKCTERLQAEGKLVEENAKQKQELTNLKNERKLLSETLANELEREKKLIKLIVNDYEPLMKMRDNLKTDIAELTSSRNDLLQSKQVKVECSLKYCRAIECINKLIESVPLDAVFKKYSTIKSTHSTINKSEDDYNKLLSFRDEIQHDEQSLNSECVKIDENLQAFRLKKENLTTSLMTEIEQLQTEHEEIKSKVKNVLYLAAEYDKQIEYAKACCHQHEENYKFLSVFYQKQYKKIFISKVNLDRRVDTVFRDANKKTINFNLIFTKE